VDPSSTFSGGATLGDRIRMLDRWNDSGVYIRSLATRGLLGGLSAAVHDASHLLDAFGFDTIIIETVGVGQAEVDISQVAQTVILLQVPGLGDSVQTIKAGVLEIADILVVNKADTPGADALVIDLRHMLRLTEHRSWTPPIVELVATTGDGIARLTERVADHAEFLAGSEHGAARALQRARDDVLQTSRRRLDRSLRAAINAPELAPLMAEVTARRVAPATAVEEVLRRIERTQPVS
jgi:LAO/AO transport system kinase